MTGRAPFLLCLTGMTAGIVAGLWLRAGVRTAGLTGEHQKETPVERGDSGAVRLPVGANAAALRDRITAELAGGAPSGLRLEALFMEWFQMENDLWPVFLEMEKQYPGHTEIISSSFFAAWAWKDCRAACEKISGSSLKSRGEAIKAAWKVACVLESDAASSLEAGLYVKDWSPLDRVAQRNPDFAVRMLGGLRDSSESPGDAPRSVLAVARGWAAADPPAALAWAASLKEGSQGAVRAVCAVWNRQDPNAIRNVTGPLRQRVDEDPVLAVLSAGSATPGSYPLPGSEARAAALLDPFATLDDVLRLMKASTAAGRVPGGLSPYRADRSGEWSPVDPRATLQTLLALPPGPERDRTVSPLLSSWNLSDPEAAAAFAAQRGMKIWKAESPSAANAKKVEGLTLAEAEHICLSAEGGTPDFNALSIAVAGQVKEDPSAVTAFFADRMDKLENNEGHWRMVLTGAAMIWSELDLGAATEWAASLPAGPVRDEAIGGVVQAMSEYDPESALTWMATMQNPNSGSRDLKGVTGELVQQLGKVGARLAMQRSSLPEEQMQEMIRSIK